LKPGQLPRILALLTVTFIIVSMAFVMPASAEHTWTEEVLDHGENIGFVPSIELDSSNNPVIAYSSIFGLNYTTKSGSTWTTEQVLSSMTFDTDLKMDSSGNPHIACLISDYFTEEIKYASKSGGAWTNTTILTNIHTEGYISLSLDDNDNPYILCQLTDSGLVTKTLALFYPSGSVWVQENITLYGGWEGYDMAIGGGNIHVVYENASSFEIYYASRPLTGGSWQFEKLKDGGITDGSVSMDMDSSGNPHIIIGRDHVWKNGAPWLSETLDMVYSSNYEWLDLYIDSNDNLHAAIFISWSLIYGQKTGSTWEFEAVRTDNDGYYSSIVVDNAGMPHIAHCSINWSNLTYHVGTPLSNPDTDGDGLPDIWESNYFGNLDQDATDNPDGDSYSNLHEYQSNTDPTDPNDPATPTNPDSDGDGLPDNWEQTNFGTLDQGAADDPDSDGHDNLDEYNAGTDPMDSSDPWVDPNDTDGDDLPDTWEQNHFGNLDQDATDDPDNDIFDNLAEYGAGSDPNDPNSTPLDFGMDILSSILLWAVLAIVVIVVIVILVIYLFIKAVHDDDIPISQHYAPPPPPPPVYAPAHQQPPPPMYCPNCGQESRFIPESGNWCDSCGKHI